MTNRRTAFAIAAWAVFSLSGTFAAFAHTHLVRATPAVDGTIHTAPSEVTLRFSEKLESAFSSVVVRDSEGNQIDKGNAQLDKSDRRIMRVSLPPLAPAAPLPPLPPLAVLPENAQFVSSSAPPALKIAPPLALPPKPPLPPLPFN